MTRSQPELFKTETQPDLFGADAVPAYRPDPDKVRSRLHKILMSTCGTKVPLGTDDRFPLSHHCAANDALAARG
jgi:hypothetical protein